MRLLTLTALAALPLLPLKGAQAQSVTLSIPQGTRVRVSAANLVAPLIANFLQMRGDTAVFIEDASGSGIWSIHIHDISKLEKSTGERRQNKSYVVRGVSWGSAIGAGAGFAFALALKPSDPELRYSKIPTTAIGAGVGAIVGGVVGTRFSSERWTNVAVPRRVSVMPTRGGASLGLQWTF